ncbi:MAG: prolyl oligopeptidase family serine peptidase [Lachnospiraceae bacterium]|nr:prolyl oligopeptidase family serine peptidase [Lachnospiraceae bacterium]
MKYKTAFLFLLVLMIFGCKRTEKGYEIEGIKATETEHVYECTFAGDTRKFCLYLPEPAEGDLPLVIMLHGYAGSPEAFRRETLMDEAACARGYAVVYAGMAGVQWNTNMGPEGKPDVEWLSALAKYMKKNYHCDPKRIYVAGFSDGAFMSQRLALEAQDTFTAVCTVGGTAANTIWDARSQKADIGVMLMYGTEDGVFPSREKGTDHLSQNPAIEVLLEYWVQANSLGDEASETLSDRATLTRYTSPASTKEVDRIVIDRYSHAWPEEKYCGFDPRKVILDFFDRCR